MVKQSKMLNLMKTGKHLIQTEVFPVGANHKKHRERGGGIKYCLIHVKIIQAKTQNVPKVFVVPS